jgi:hypothetical protein
MGTTEKFQPIEPSGFEPEPEPEQEKFTSIDPAWDDEPEPEQPEKFQPIEAAGWDDEESEQPVSEPEAMTGAVPPEPGGPEGTTGEIKAWVGDSQQRAQDALDAEAAKENPRSSLMTWLEGVIHGK